MKFLRHLSWILRALLFAALFLFALKNTDPVTIRFYFGQFWQVPLVLVMLGFFAFGALLGTLACLPRLFAQRRELHGLRRKIGARDEQRAPTPPVDMGA